MMSIAIDNEAVSRGGAPLIDPKLLQLFEQLYLMRSVTRAAESLGQEQPTVSIWLGKLRRHFGDPLFVRTSRGMQPTPRAEALLGRVREALAGLRGVAGEPSGFDAATAERRFRIAMTDATQITMLPRLLSHLRAAAPRVVVDVEHISLDTGRALESGDVDVALGFLPALDAGFYQQRLFTQDFVCLANARHPRIRGTLSLRQFADEAHIGVELAGTGHATIERALERQRVRRRITLRVPGFLGLAAIVSTTDLIATVPRGIGEALAVRGSLRLCACPVRIPAYAVKQHWHARYHHDAGNRWLRAACAALFAAPRARVADAL